MEYNSAACTGDGQKLGKHLWKIHISFLIWSWATTGCNTSCILLGIDSCKFWIVSCGILYHSSSSCLTDDEGNLLLTLLSKTDQSDSMIFKLGNCASQRRCWSASSCFSNKDWSTSYCVYGCTVVLKNCIIVSKQPLDHKMHLAT
jgi:hypothetical protein